MTFRPPDNAPCLTSDPDLYFSSGKGQQAAKHWCLHACPALRDCRADTLARDAAAAAEPWGTSGGMSQAERRRARKTPQPAREGAPTTTEVID